MQFKYQTPCVKVVVFESENLLLTQSQFGSGAGDFEDDGEIDF